MDMPSNSKLALQILLNRDRFDWIWEWGKHAVHLHLRSSHHTSEGRGKHTKLLNGDKPRLKLSQVDWVSNFIV